MIRLKCLPVIKLENVASEDRENIAPEVHQNTLITQLRRSNGTNRSPQRYSKAQHYILLIDGDELEGYSNVMQDSLCRLMNQLNVSQPCWRDELNTLQSDMTIYKVTKKNGLLIKRINMMTTSDIK